MFEIYMLLFYGHLGAYDMLNEQSDLQNWWGDVRDPLNIVLILTDVPNYLFIRYKS
jgi:hypothetical protein